MTITVFTPSYNRAHLLHVAFDSLCEQCVDSDFNFEWLIVDDGSTDNTEEVVKGFIAEKKIPIRYVKKPNGGKHTAINVGAREAKGELFLILDSDDSLPKNSLKIILEQYNLVKNEENIAGVCGLMAHHDGTRIGSGYPKNCIIASSIEQRYTYKVTGDVAEVFKTSVFREFPFPEVQGERFCPEDLVWNRIAQKYKLYCFNKVIYYRDYLDGGLTDNIMRVRRLSPIASMTYYAELFNFDSDGPLYLPHKEEYFKLPFGQKIKAAINYWRFTPLRYYGKLKEMHMMNIVSLCALPIGILMRLNDKRHI